ncbi:transcription regulator [Lactobacillus selangorensis]|uniref:Transcription regulator n=1 Tax=Lactobacillus selangorensis TaxID=81857 RepID=A0A0R2FWY6_9LACO|nr:AraC family transcriptional regulator [Lactobacillus selangorensis]KRN28717.1 transcription regulator [Lactobacillus selangorensis]KRN32873.1 transcription regulator [Lactobacillus selangorensis]
MTITHEVVQVVPRLPFKFYLHDPLTKIDVAPHWHQGIELNYLLKGDTLHFVTDGHTTDYRPGDLWAVNRRVVHSATGAPDVDWDEFGLIIDDTFLVKQLPESVNWELTLHGPVSQRADAAAYQTIQQHLLAIRRLLDQQVTDLSRLAILSHFYALLNQLGTAFAVPLVSVDISANPNLVNTVVSYINIHYAVELTGAELANRFHTSLTTLNQQFNANLQMSISKYIRLVRLMNARRLLLDTDQTIEAIAANCGFPNQKTLTRNFKAWKKMTPSAYRARLLTTPKTDRNCF